MRFAVLKEIFRVVDYVPMPLDILISMVVCMHINNKENDAPLSRGATDSSRIESKNEVKDFILIKNYEPAVACIHRKESDLTALKNGIDIVIPRFSQPSGWS